MSAFAVFCVAAVATPWAILRFVQRAMREDRIEVSTVSGTTQLRERGQTRWLAVSDKALISQGSAIQTDGAARSIIQVYEGPSSYVLVTVHVFSNTRLTLMRATNPRFKSSRQPNHVVIALEQGRLRLNPGPALDRELELMVKVPAGNVSIEEGSVGLEVTADATEVAVRSGRAVVITDEEQLALETGERAVLASDGTIKGPLPSGRNLVVNGDFGAGLAMAWEAYNDQGGDGGTADGQVLLVEADGQRAVRFQRLGNQRDHCETGVRQALKRDVTDYVSLRLRADLRLLTQSLSGGGFQGSEFPLMIRLNYRDAQGNLQFYTWAFYYENPANNPTPRADQIERGVWFAYESPDLMATLGDIKPAYLESIQVYASGHDYESEVSDIQVIVE
ncbi:MAG: hypothetical protein ACUVWR_01005 [Anaerolineae bacterium]